MGFLKEAVAPQNLEGRTYWFGFIAETITEFNQRAWVILPEWSNTLRVGPCFWQSRDDVSMPHAGNRCLVMFDNRRNAWITAWWPFDT